MYTIILLLSLNHLLLPRIKLCEYSPPEGRGKCKFVVDISVAISVECRSSIGRESVNILAEWSFTVGRVSVDRSTISQSQ